MSILYPFLHLDQLTVVKSTHPIKGDQNLGEKLKICSHLLFLVFNSLVLSCGLLLLFSGLK